MVTHVAVGMNTGDQGAGESSKTQLAHGLKVEGTGQDVKTTSSVSDISRSEEGGPSTETERNRSGGKKTSALGCYEVLNCRSQVSHWIFKNELREAVR